jgi:hypothetical protein
MAGAGVGVDGIIQTHHKSPQWLRTYPEGMCEAGRRRARARVVIVWWAQMPTRAVQATLQWMLQHGGGETVSQGRDAQVISHPMCSSKSNGSGARRGGEPGGMGMRREEGWGRSRIASRHATPTVQTECEAQRLFKRACTLCPSHSLHGRFHTGHAYMSRGDV